MVGKSGAIAERLSPVTASARNRPLLTCGMPDGMESNSTCTWPDATSGIASAVPLYGTCVIGMPACALNASDVRCTMVPLPLLA